MRNSKILAKIRAGKPARIAYLGHFLPRYVAHAAHQGYDGLWIDLEHNAMDTREVQMLLAFTHLYDIDGMVRVPTREKTRLYRYLEDGAAGLMVPHVSTPEEAHDLVSKTKFPPIGDRGLVGIGLDADFGMYSGERKTYIEHVQRETFLVVQIETPEGLANAEAIAAVPGIDGLYIGPSDMQMRMEYLPEAERVSGVDLMKRIAAACKPHNRAWGCFTLAEEPLRQQLELGAKLILWGADFKMIRDSLTQCADDLNTLLGEP